MVINSTIVVVFFKLSRIFSIKYRVAIISKVDGNKKII